MNISEYEQEALKDLEVNPTTINSYCLKIGYLRAKWAKYLFSEEDTLNQLEANLANLYRDKMLHYTYDSEIILDKKNIEIAINGDEEYLIKRKEVNAQKSLIKYINEVISTLNAQSFYLNTCVKHLIWQSGE